MNKDLSNCECKYLVIEKECYAIVWAVKSLWIYSDKEFVTESDYCVYRGWEWVILLRWNLSLYELEVRVENVPGKLNAVADTLFRLEE